MDRREFLAAIMLLLLERRAEAQTRGYYEGTADYVPGWQSRFFQPHEFASKGNGRVFILKRMVRALDHTRRRLGLPIHIVSGYRDPRHNSAVGGARNSRHMHGDAVDIDISRYSDHDKYRLCWFLLEAGFTSFGTYGGNMIHADMRPYAATWHHGRGGQPWWLRKALRDWKWRPGRGSTYR